MFILAFRILAFRMTHTSLNPMLSDESFIFLNFYYFGPIPTTKGRIPRIPCTLQIRINSQCNPLTRSKSNLNTCSLNHLLKDIKTRISRNPIMYYRDKTWFGIVNRSINISCIGIDLSCQASPQTPLRNPTSLIQRSNAHLIGSGSLFVRSHSSIRRG